MTKLAAAEVAALGPYKFMAIIGKTVIHPGRPGVNTGPARLRPHHRPSQVLDVGGACRATTQALPQLLPRGSTNSRHSGLRDPTDAEIIARRPSSAQRHRRLQGREDDRGRSAG